MGVDRTWTGNGRVGQNWSTSTRPALGWTGHPVGAQKGSCLGGEACVGRGRVERLQPPMRPRTASVNCTPPRRALFQSRTASEVRIARSFLERTRGRGRVDGHLACWGKFGQNGRGVWDPDTGLRVLLGRNSWAGLQAQSVPKVHSADQTPESGPVHTPVWGRVRADPAAPGPWADV